MRTAGPATARGPSSCSRKFSLIPRGCLRMTTRGDFFRCSEGGHPGRDVDRLASTEDAYFACRRKPSNESHAAALAALESAGEFRRLAAERSEYLLSLCGEEHEPIAAPDPARDEWFLKFVAHRAGREAAGIDRRVLRQWLDRGEKSMEPPYHDFAAAVRRARDECFAELLALIKDSPAGGNSAAARWLQKRVL